MISADNDTQVITVTLNRALVEGDKDVTIEGYTLDNATKDKTELKFNPTTKEENDTATEKEIKKEIKLGDDKVKDVTIKVAADKEAVTAKKAWEDLVETVTVTGNGDAITEVKVGDDTYTVGTEDGNITIDKAKAVEEALGADVKADTKDAYTTAKEALDAAIAGLKGEQ